MSSEDDVLTRGAPPPNDTRPYAAGLARVYDVRFPSSPTSSSVQNLRPSPSSSVQNLRRGTVLVVHGGFWREEYDRAHTGPQAAGLAAAGWHVAVGEYRRTGMAGGGWPGTFIDIADLVAAVAADRDLPRPLVLMGHSAGGHLVAWAANQRWAEDVVAGVVILAGCVDLGATDRLGLGAGAARAFLGDPATLKDDWMQADPMSSLPPRVPVRLIHGDNDDAVPVEVIADYVERGRNRGGDLEVDIVSGVGHYDLIDPQSAAWSHVLATLQELTGR